MSQTTAPRSDDARAARRTAQSRRARCERNLRRLGREYDAHLYIDAEKRTAHINQTKDPSEAVISGREFPQPVTDYSPLAWDWLCQRLLTAHEAAHARYTNHEDFAERLRTRFDRSEQELAKDLWNAGEDTAIEAQLRRDVPNYDAIINTFRENRAAASLHSENAILSLADATTVAVLEKGTYDSGRLDVLLDQNDGRLQFRDEQARETFENTILPAVNDMLADVLDESYSPRRNERLLDFAREVVDAIKEDEQEQEQEQEQQGDDGDEQDNSDDGQSGNDDAGDEDEESEAGQGDAEGDESGDAGEPAPAEGLDTDDADGPDGFPDDASDMDDDGEAEEADELDGAETDDNGEVEAPASSDDVETDEELEQELEEKAEQDTPDAEGGDDSSTGRADDEIVRERPDDAVDEGTWRSAMQEADRLERVLKQLIESDTSRRKRFQRRGRVDGTQIHRTATGEKRINVQRNKPEEPDLTFVLVLDRSGSMGGRISQAEIATIAFAEALERVGVQVAVYDLHNNAVRVGCNFDTPIQRAKSSLATGAVGGGTPLSDAIDMAVDEIPAASRDSCRALVISDDNPNSPERYRGAVQNCPFPVVGVLLSDTADMDLYTRAVTVNQDGSDISSSLQNLAYELVHA